MKWLEFSSPCRVLTTHRIDEVIPLMRQIEASVRDESLHAAGFIAYEAAPAFDPALPVKADGEFPLLWFGLFRQVDEITLPCGDREPGVSIDWRPSVSREEYDRCIRDVREHIRNGDTYQVNFTYRFQGEAALDPWRLFLQIAGDGEAPFAGFVDTGEWAVCSASPELFLRIDGDRVESRPMKGTAARGLWIEDDQAKSAALTGSEKERAENVMIVDMVRNDLGRIAEIGSVQVPSLLAVEKYPTVWQLTSTVVARASAPLDRILQATFPPASITGAPKRRTMAIIADLESTPRRLYTGTIGFISPGRRAQLNVAIRTVLLHKPTGRAEYGVGGGIVWDSSPAAEFDESLAKARVLAPRLRNFDLLETLLWTPADGYSLLEHHLRRLAGSAAYFGFSANREKVRESLSNLAATLPAEPHRVRLRVSRRGGVECQATSLRSASPGFGKVAWARRPVDARDIFLYHKTTCRVRYEEALAERPGFDDVLLFNASGEVTESTRANLAVEIRGVLYTPPIRCGLLPGTQRAWLLEQARLRERVLTVQDVLESPNVYLFNSVRGMHRIDIV
jgi:para-aminobenzoate synthetase/4-amino-4-deoxychorismate lyase